MTKVLVAVASKHGSTREIADAIGRVLVEQKIDVEVEDINNVVTLEDYNAVIVGSAVYAGNWLRSARHFVKHHSQELQSRPTWLFSSGPIGTTLKPEADKAVLLETIMYEVQPREHRLFAGKLSKENLSFGERAMVMAFHAPDGDYRNWDDIQDWAKEIAHTIKQILP